MRRMCKNMSSKRYLLICILSLLFGLLTAQNQYDFGFDLMTQKYENEKTDTYYLNYISADINLTKTLRLNVENHFRKSDNEPGDYLEKSYDYLYANLSYSNEKLSSNLSVLNRNHGNSDYLSLYFDLDNGFYKKNNRNILSYSLDYNEHGLTLNNTVRYKQDDFRRRKRISGLWNYYDDQKTALMYNGELKYQFVKGISVGASVFTKNENNDVYDHNSLSFNLNYEHTFDYFKWLDVQTEWIWNQSDLIQHKNQIVTHARFKYRMGTNLNAFLSAYNHMVYQNDTHEFLLASNYLRAQLKYNFDYDLNAESYVLTGAKYSEENYASAIFAEIKNHIWHQVYFSYGYQYKQVVINTHTIQLMWYFMPYSHIYYSYQMVNDNDFYSKYNTMNIGMLWSF